MSKIFISFIGRGKWADGQSAYQKTKYDFGNDVICETSCFADAVAHRQDLQTFLRKNPLPSFLPGEYDGNTTGIEK